MPTCLLIVDVQKGFINQHTRHIPALVEQIQEKYDFTIATRFFNEPDSFFRKLMGWHRFGKGSGDVELAFSARPDALILDKPAYTCVTPGLMGFFKEKNISEVHVCGIDTDICVTKCAVDLFENKIVPVVLGYYCASCAGPDAHAHALETLARYIGDGQVR